MNGGIQVSGPGADAGFQHRHVQERRAHVNHDLATGRADKGFGGFNIIGIKLVRTQYTRALQITLFLDGVNNGFAFGYGTRGNINITQQFVVLRAFVCGYMSNATGTDNKYISFHWCTPFI